MVLSPSSLTTGSKPETGIRPRRAPVRKQYFANRETTQSLLVSIPAVTHNALFYSQHKFGIQSR